MSGPLPSIPIGDLALYDDYVPALDAGNWFVDVHHALLEGETPVNTTPLGATQEFVVSAPQYAIDPSEIVSVYPPANSTGLYADVLPHVVLSEPLLPWERAMADGGRQPWLALLVLGEDEVVGGDGNPVHMTATTVGAFRTPGPANVLKPLPALEGDVQPTDPTSYVQLSAATFQAIAPRLHELRFLAHCRQADTGDKAIDGINENGLFSVVVGNRFPAAPARGTTAPAKSIVHLVSLEGIEPYLVAEPAFGAYDTVALVSLASWAFWTLPDNLADFRGLMNAMVAQGSAASGCKDAAGMLRLRRDPAKVDTSTAAGVEAARRLCDGFVPLEYATRSGEATFAWYRGPFTPIATQPRPPAAPYLTSDAAAAYHADFGVFDMSLAAAFEAGRATALADKGFGQALLDFRTRGHRLTDALLQRLQSDAFSATQIASLDADTSAHDELLALLRQQLLADVGQGNAPVAPANGGGSSGGPDETPLAALKAFMAEPEVQQAVIDAIQVDLDPVATWLSRLLLLVPVPFHYLVPDAQMLPAESLRFFHVDSNWLEALLDGAVGIGMESSRETFFHEITHELVHDSAYTALTTYRGSVAGSASAGADAGVMSGLLMRSAIVSGWPNLAVRAYDADGLLMKTLRMDHLAPTVLLCLFAGVPSRIEIAEPQEGFRFGIEEDGTATLRNVVPGKLALGAQLAVAPFPVRDQTGAQAVLMRAAGSRVLNVDPDSTAGLVQQMGSIVLKDTGGQLGPADFALQMVNSPEAVKLTPSGGTV